MSLKRFSQALGGSVGLALVLVPLAAAAGGSTAKGYGGRAGVQGTLVSQGQLPYTGLSLALAVGFALLLIVLGTGLRRASRRQS
jgi:hypothetical protein